MMADFVAIGLRALAFAATLLAAGLPVFCFVFGSELDRSIRRVRAMIAPTAVFAALLTIGHALVEPARLTGALSGVLDLSLQAMLLSSDHGTTAAIRTLGLLAIVAGWLRPSRSGECLALIGASLAIASFAFMGHTASDAQRWFLAPLLLVHLVVAAAWFGSLWPLLVLTRCEDAAVSARVIERFSKIAVRTVPVIFLAGIAMAGVLLPDLASLRAPYGMSLTAKVAGFSMLMSLAAMNRWRFGPRIGAGDAVALRAFRRSVLAEWALILAVVAVTAVMTALFAPPH